MRTTREPRRIAAAITDNPVLPAGEDERLVGYGVMGLPFASGHYLALRVFPATSFADGYRAVWHRDPVGLWQFLTTAPAHLSCPRYFDAAAARQTIRCGIDVEWRSGRSLDVRIEGILSWRVEIESRVGTRLMSTMGSAMPQWVWDNSAMLSAMGRMAGPILGAGRVRLRGATPNGQAFAAAPKLVWSITNSKAVLDGVDLGSPGPLPEQARLAGFWLPQRGIFAAGHSRFEALDPARHALARPAMEDTRPS